MTDIVEMARKIEEIEAKDEMLAALRAEVGALKKDAERYRFLRIGGMAELYCVRPDVGIMSGLPLDQAIDAALADKQEPG